MKDSSSSPSQVTLDRYREMFEEIEDILLILAEDGTIEYVNRALRKRLGYPHRKYTGQMVSRCLMPVTFQGSEEDFVKMLFRQRHLETTLMNSRKQPLSLSWKTKLFAEKGEKKLMAVIRDVTKEAELKKKTENYSKSLQEAVHKRSNQLQREKQKAVDLHQAKAIFLSKMSHELRTPLTSIKGYAELLQDRALKPEEREKFVSVVQRNAQTLLDMINETLDMIKVEQDKYAIKDRSFILSTVLQDLEDTFQILAQEKQLRLEFKMADDLPQKLYSDPQAIKQILTNLIGNAIKFTQEGSVTVTVKMRTFPHKSISKLYFYVRDTGLGIPKEYHRRIFKSFEQYLDHHVVPARGTGLGLAISQQMARLLGGNVKLVSSSPHKGSKFVFSLPIREKVKT